MRLPALRRPRAKLEPVDRALYPMDYTGPANRHGLAPGPCCVERKWASGYIIRLPSGRRYTVARKHVTRP